MSADVKCICLSKLCSAAEREQPAVLQHWSYDSVTASSEEIGTYSATASSDRPPIRDEDVDVRCPVLVPFLSRSPPKGTL